MGQKCGKLGMDMEEYKKIWLYFYILIYVYLLHGYYIIIEIAWYLEMDKSIFKSNLRGTSSIRQIELESEIIDNNLRKSYLYQIA